MPIFIKTLSLYILRIIKFPIILALRHISNLIECMAMFYFIKRLSALRIITEPCADRFLLFGGFPIFGLPTFSAFLSASILSRSSASARSRSSAAFLSASAFSVAMRSASALAATSLSLCASATAFSFSLIDRNNSSGVSPFSFSAFAAFNFFLAPRKNTNAKGST